MDYFQLFAEIGGIDEDNLDDMICDMGNVATETKSISAGIQAEKPETERRL